MNPAEIRLRIHGMTCGSCVARVERALSTVPGIQQARVNLATETAVVSGAGEGVAPSALIAAVREAGFDAEPARTRTTEAGHDVQARRKQEHRQALVQAVGLGLPVIVLEYVAPLLASDQPGGHIWWRVLQAILCALLFMSAAGGPILAGGLRALLHRTPNMDLLVSLGVVTAFLAGLVSLVVPGAHAFYFDAAAMIVGFITLGRYFEAGARREASSAVAALARRLPKTAVRYTDGQWETVPVEQVVVGDKVRVAQGTMVPVDGRVVEGSAATDDSAITGESVPVARGQGDAVRAGAVVAEGMITIEATAVGSASTIGRVLRAVEDAQTGRTRMQRIADQVAGVFVPIVLALALATLIGWLVSAGNGWAELPADYSRIGWALRCAVAVLVIACPCAMGLATPTAVLVATGAAALRGILVRDAAALEAAGQVDVVLLDKTGTLTTGLPEVKSVFDEPIGPFTEGDREVLAWAASAEQFSQHPLAKAIVAKARESNVPLREVEEFSNDPGLGVAARIDGKPVLVGNSALLAKHGIDAKPIEVRHVQMATDGQTVVILAIDGVCAGLISLGDTLRPGAPQAVQRIADAGIDVGMVTGDLTNTATAVAASAGIKHVYAEMMPEQKLDEVRRRQEAGQRVAFVGDGINDAPALTASDVGIAFAAGTDVAVASADITLLGSDLSQVADAIHIARRSMRIIKQNLFWAFFYNVAAIPLAATGLIPPGLAAAAMMCSSISVVLNSLRLRRNTVGRAPGD